MRYMTRRPLTLDELEAAKNLRRIWDKRKIERATSKNKLTQEYAADLFGVTQGQIGKYLNGLQPLNAENVLKFAKLLEVEPEEIMPIFKFGKYRFSASLISDNDSDKINRFVLSSAMEAVKEIAEQRHLALTDAQIMDYVAEAHETLDDYDGDISKNLVSLVVSLIMPPAKPHKK